MSWLRAIWWWIEVHTGTVNEAGPYYGWWSGFGSQVQQDIVFLGPLLLVAHHLNCDVKGCKRPGPHKYEKDGHVHKVCRKHHPALETKNTLTGQDLQDHFDARA